MPGRVPERPPSRRAVRQRFRDCCVRLPRSAAKGAFGSSPERPREGEAETVASQPHPFPLGRDIQIARIHAIPELIEQLTGKRLLQLKIEPLAKACNSETILVRIRDGLDIAPAPAPAVKASTGDVIDAALAKAQHAAAASPGFVMPRGHLRVECSFTIRNTIDHCFGYA